MKPILFYPDEETRPLLEKEKNMSATIRAALKLYYSDISTSDMDMIRKGYRALADKMLEVDKRTKEIDSKLEYLAGRIT